MLRTDSHATRGIEFIDLVVHFVRVVERETITVIVGGDGARDQRSRVLNHRRSPLRPAAVPRLSRFQFATVGTLAFEAHRRRLRCA